MDELCPECGRYVAYCKCELDEEPKCRCCGERLAFCRCEPWAIEDEDDEVYADDVPTEDE